MTSTHENKNTADDVRKLTAGELHLLKLIRRDADVDGWAPISAAVYPLVHPLPRRLIECLPFADGTGSARLTEEGRGVLNAMVWLCGPVTW